MISFDDNGGESNVNLTPIYNSILVLSANKLDSSVFTNFTNTFTITDSYKYQINYSDIESDVNKNNLYNITGSVLSQNINQLKMTGDVVFDNDTFNLNQNVLNVNSLGNNLFSNTDASGSLTIHANNLTNNTFNLKHLEINGDISGNQILTVSEGKFNGAAMNNNIISYGEKFDINYFNVNSNSFVKISDFHITANEMKNNTLVYIYPLCGNIRKIHANSLTYVSIINNASDIRSNEMKGVNDFGYHAFFENNTATNYYLYAGKCHYFENNSLLTGNLIGNFIYSIQSNTFSSFSSILNTGNDFVGNNISVNSLCKLLNSRIVVNSIKDDVFICDNYCTSNLIIYNSIDARTISFNKLEKSLFTENSFTVSKEFDFNFGSSVAYDASLNYLLSDYVNESKVLGKYNLVPYVRELKNNQFKYQLNYSEIPTYANYNNIYNVSGTMRMYNLQKDYLNMSYLDLLSSNMLNINNFDLKGNEVYHNMITASSILNFNVKDMSYNTIIGSSKTGLLNLKINNMLYNTISNLSMINMINVDSMNNNSFESIDLMILCNVDNYINVFKNISEFYFTGSMFNDNTFNGVNICNINAYDLNNNVIYGRGKIDFYNGSYNKIIGFDGNINGPFLENNSFTENILDMKVYYLTENSFSGNRIYGTINSVYLNTFSKGIINCKYIAGFYNNSISLGDMLNIDYLKTCNSNFIYNTKNYITCESMFKNNTVLCEEMKLEKINTNLQFSSNSIKLDSLYINNINKDDLSKNTIVINNYLDFNYGSSNVYDSNLNYLLSDYIDESKVLGKYNLIPYLRNMNNKGNITFKLGVQALDDIAEGGYSSNSSSLCPEWGAHYNYLKHYGRIYTSTGSPNSFTYYDFWEADFNAVEAGHNNNACENLGLWRMFSASLSPYTRVFYYTYPSYKIRPPSDCYGGMGAILNSLKLDTFVSDFSELHFSHSFNFTSANTSFSTMFVTFSNLFTNLQTGSSSSSQQWTYTYFTRTGTF